jgi:hypothetical protein
MSRSHLPALRANLEQVIPLTSRRPMGEPASEAYWRAMFRVVRGLTTKEQSRRFPYSPQAAFDWFLRFTQLRPRFEESLC